MEDCLFCKIIKGEIPSKKVYEDDKVLVFLDINPNTNGHMLMIPKTHYKDITDIDMDTLTYMISKIKEVIIPTIEEKLNCKGFSLSQNNGIVEEVKHFHIHIIPRYGDDDLKLEINKEKLIDTDSILEKLK